MASTSHPKGVTGVKKRPKEARGSLREHTNPKPGPGVTLIGANYDYADLSGVDLTGATIIGGSYKGTNFTGANLSGVNCMALHHEVSPDFSGAIFDGAGMGGMLAPECSFKGASLVKADMKGVNLFKGDLSRCDLHYADFYGCGLRGVNFSQANISKANFKVAALLYCDFTEVVALETNFLNARVSDSNFKGANLKGSILKGATVSRCELGGANFTEVFARGATFDENKGTKRAKWHNADLYWSRWNAWRDKDCVMPSGWTTKNSGVARLDSARVARRAVAMGYSGDLAVVIHEEQANLDFREVMEVVRAMSLAIGQR